MRGSHILHPDGGARSVRATAGIRLSGLFGGSGAVVNWAGITLWLIGLADILSGGRLPPAVSMVACALFVVIALPAINRVSYAPILISVIGMAVICLPAWDADPVMAGLSFGTRLGAFLFSALLLRQTLTGTVSLARVQDRFDALAPRDQMGVALLAAWVFGSVFSIGTVILMTALVERRPAAERRGFAPVLLCGMCLSFLWSPFSIGMVFVSRLVPQVGLVDVIGPTAALSLAGLLAGLAFHSRFSQAVPRGAIAAVTPLLPALAVLFGAVALVCQLAGLTTQAAIIVVTPPLCLLFLARRESGVIGPLLAATRDRTGTAMADVLLFSAGLGFAVALDRSGVIPLVLEDLVTPGAGPLALVLLVLSIAPLCMSGLHTTTMAAIIAPAALAMQAPAPVAFAMAQVAWTGATMISFSSVMLATTCRIYDVPMRRVTLGPNVLVMQAVCVVAAAMALMM